MIEEKKTEDSKISKLSITASVFVFYFLPALFLSWRAESSRNGWGVFSLGLFIAAAGTSVFYYILQKWSRQVESKATSQIPIPISTPPVTEDAEVDLTPYTSQIELLQQALQEQSLSHQKLADEHSHIQEAYQNIMNEKEYVQQEIQTLLQDSLGLKQSANEQIDHYKELLGEHQQTIAELRNSLENKQHHILQLESKTRDLNYELKTLLRLAEKPIEASPESVAMAAATSKHPVKRSEEGDDTAQIFDFAVRTQEEAHVHLKRILDVAQRITGTSPFGSSSRFRDLPLDNYALDLRRLFERLKEVNATTIFVFSLKENKLLFINEAIKHLLGLPPEKFTQTFHELLQEGCIEWQEAIRQLSFKNEAKVGLSFKSRNGQEFHVDGLLGMIPTGIFKHHLIGILYSNSAGQKWT